MKRLLRRFRRALAGAAVGALNVSLVPTQVPEITPVVARRANGRGRRLNLVLPSINPEHYFGGIHTAVLLYRELCTHFERSRILLVDSAPRAEALQRFADHRLAPCAEESDAARQITPFSDRYGRTIPVEPDDLWLTTAWWTAYNAQRVADWQQRTYGRAPQIGYLIQDFEPGFYAWSSQSALALGTYRPQRDIAVFNTRLLADFFGASGIRYDRSLVFEPTLNAGLRAAQADLPLATPRRRRIVVYGRPSTPRNGFELICEALRLWATEDPRARDWEVVAPGELVQDVDLGPVRIRGLGKLPIDGYAELLSTSALGLSLMISPHPSYPPLEMAAFGLRVITNGFANKDLSAFSGNIRSVAGFAPELLAGALRECAAECEERGMRGLPPLPGEHPFLGAEGFGPLAAQLAALYD